MGDGGCAAKGRAKASSSIIPLNFDMFGDHAGAVSQRFHTSLPLFTGTQPLLPLTQTFFPYVYTNIPPARPACNPPGAIMGHPGPIGARAPSRARDARGLVAAGRARPPPVLPSGWPFYISVQPTQNSKPHRSHFGSSSSLKPYHIFYSIHC